jgi:beta-lactamase class A
MNNRTIFKIINISIIIFFGFFIGYFIHEIKDSQFDIKKEEDTSKEDLGYEVRDRGFYKFINPLLECEVAKGTIDSKKQNFQKDLDNFITKQLDNKQLSVMSVYFRDLNNGPSFGIKENELFIPASLLKVPIMMIFFSIAEKNPDILEKEIFFDKPRELGEPGVQFIIPSQSIEVGKKYTIEQLIESLIKYSDNSAAILLQEYLNINYAKETQEFFNFFGIEASDFLNKKGSISVKDYSRFFRVLFNSSFLNNDFSEKSLKILSEAEYDKALVSGLPEGIVVSHKFGEAGFEPGEKQLHDCGIIYYPDHPYLLCIMSRGKNLSDLEKSIAGVSKFVYEKIAEQY